MAETRRYLMYFSYIGTGFWGSQYQWCKNTGVVHPTIQNTVELALKSIFNLSGERPILIRTCSRTDSGVHALKAALRVDLPKFERAFLNPLTVKCRLNNHFIKSCSIIKILDVIQVPDTFRFYDTCISKTYLYRIGVFRDDILNRKKIKEINTPITEYHRTFFLIGKPFDIKKAEEALPLFVGEKDFGAVVRRPSENTRPTVCNILSFTVEKAAPLMACDYGNEKFDYYHFKCTGTRFLFHMVRTMVGCVISVGLGKISLNEIRKLFEKPEPSSWTSKISVLPAYGLYLADTQLDPEKLIIKEKSSDFSPVSESEQSKSAEAA